jgi:hypothetical protein
MFENINSNVVEIVGLFLTVFAAIWSLAWWLSGHFTAIRSLIYTTAEKTSDAIVSKLEYHEKHDDTRFATIDARLTDVRDDLWDIRVRNAAIDGRHPLTSRDKPKNDQ